MDFVVVVTRGTIVCFEVLVATVPGIFCCVWKEATQREREKFKYLIFRKIFNLCRFRLAK